MFVTQEKLTAPKEQTYREDRQTRTSRMYARHKKFKVQGKTERERKDRERKRAREKIFPIEKWKQLGNFEKSGSNTEREKE